MKSIGELLLLRAGTANAGVVKDSKSIIRLLVVIAGAAIVSACTSATDDEPDLDTAAISDNGAEPTIHEGYSDTASEYEVNGRVISNVDIEAPLWNSRGKTEEQIAQRATFLTSVYDLKRTDEQMRRSADAREKYTDSIVVNSVIPMAPGTLGTTAEHYAKALTRNRDAGLTLASTTIYGFPGDGDSSLAERTSKAKAVIAELDMVLAKNTGDIRQAKQDGKMAVIFNAQGADFVIDDMAVLDELKNNGLQVANFVYNQNNALAGGSTAQDMGVTDLGKEFIQQANAVSVIVDCAHSSNQTCIDAAQYSSKPIIASHANVAALFEISRNMSDEAIRAVADSGGVVCTTGVGLFLNAEGKASPSEFARHVEYTADLIGRDRTCFSTDYLHNAYEYFYNAVASVDVYPPESGFGLPVSNIAVEHVWDVVAILEDEYGWPDEDVRGFLGENLMRVYAANWD